jgi:hypothetical protein
MSEHTLFRPKGREIAEDRWEGLMLDRVNPDAPSDLSDRLCAILGEMAGGMGREPAEDSSVQDDLLEAIHEWLVIWAETGGVSPTDAGESFTFTMAPRIPLKETVAA